MRSDKDTENSLKDQGMLPNFRIFDEKSKQEKNNSIDIQITEVSLDLDINTILVLLTNYTENFSNFEQLLYESDATEVDKLKIRFGLSLDTTEKKMEQSKLKKYLDQNKDEGFQVEEYSNLKKCIKQLDYAGKKYLAFAYGGFSQIHELANFLSIPLISHNPLKCFFARVLKLNILKLWMK